MEPPPGALPEPIRSLIANVCKLPTGLLLILNLERAMELDAWTVEAPAPANATPASVVALVP